MKIMEVNSHRELLVNIRLTPSVCQYIFAKIGFFWTSRVADGIIQAMNGHTASPISESALPSSMPLSVTVSAGPDPSAILSLLCQHCPLRRENSILRNESSYWRSMHERANVPEEQLKAEIKELEAKITLREHQLFGRKTEQGTSGSDQPCPETPSCRKRGQQRGRPGHGRRRHRSEGGTGPWSPPPHRPH